MVKRSFTQTIFDILFLTILSLLILAAQPDGMVKEVVAQCHLCTRWSVSAFAEGQQLWTVFGQILLAFRDVLDRLGGISNFW
ncbi:MAG: hypothetical protein KJZ86_10785 [Caldilineaceae bacterium]|nr:hypothetical protein [Caldilineaceae bacterium]HRJ44359.1 hypothetical protein [Caldilineaceae bacterium]